MKKTFYISEEAWDILKEQKNKSRFICDLILATRAHRTASEKQLDIETIIALVNTLKGNTDAIQKPYTDNALQDSINEMLNL